MNDECNNLDAYLADGLVAKEAAAFTNHLLNCAACSEVVDEQRWIDGLLLASKSEAIEVPPQSVLMPVRASIADRQRRKKSLAWSLAAAATIVVALGWTVLNRPITHSKREVLVESQDATNSKSLEDARKQARFVANSKSIAVPVASRHPDVTVVRVFPTYRPQLEAAAAATDPNAGRPQSWQQLSNGG